MVGREQQIMSWCIAGGIACLLLAGGLWWQSTSVNPERVFWGALSNNFAAQGVTLQSTQTSEGSVTKQILQLDFGVQKKARSVTQLKRGTATVTTENLSTASNDYTRYLTLDTGAKTATAKKAGIEGVWAKTTGQQAGDKGLPQLFSQVLLGLSAPFGNLSAADRATILRQARESDLYKTDYSKVTKAHKDGRLLYTYDVKMQPILYVRYMKNYAKAMGLHGLDQVDPNQYSGAEVVRVKWTIDAHARRLVSADYGNSHVETYSGYGLQVQQQVPAHPISAAELEKRLSTLR